MALLDGMVPAECLDPVFGWVVCCSLALMAPEPTGKMDRMIPKFHKVT